MLLGTVSGWYRYDVSFSAELIDSFVKSVEEQVAESISRYQHEKRTEAVECEGADGKFTTSVEMHAGLESESWNLDTVFREYFPNLQRRSAFLTVYGYFEHELDKLCVLYQSEKGFVLSFRDLKQDGIDRSTSYLEKVAGLEHKGTSAEWNRVDGLRKVRNAIAHRDGRLKAGEDKKLRTLLDKLKPLVALNAYEEIILKEGFLSHVTDVCNSYFKFVDRLIQAREALK